MRLNHLIISGIFLFPVMLNAQNGHFADTVQLTRKMDMLNKKFYLDFPAGAKTMPRVADIMAADPNQNMETRIFVEFGEEKLVFFAQESFILAGDNFLADLNKAEPTGIDYTRHQQKAGDSIITILNTPAAYDTAASAILINSFLIKNPDQTVSRVDAYINGPAFAKKDEYLKLSERIFNTAAKGSRKLNLAARTESYKIFGTQRQLQFKLPKNYYVTVDEKYDFGVFKINTFRNLGDTTYSSLTIYAGHHPTYFYSEYELEESAATKQAGKFLDQPVSWLYFRDESKSLFLKEQFVKTDFIDTGLILHVAATTNTKEALDQLMKIVDNTTVSK